MLPPIPPGWKPHLEAETHQPYFHELDAFLDREREANHTILPESQDIFNALRSTPYASVRVLLLGQDLSLIHI